MIELYNLGLTDVEMKEIIEIYPQISDINKEEISININLLRNINLNEKEIKNIVISNPFYLNRTYEDVSELIIKLKELGISDIEMLIDSNPFILNKDSYEIDEYIIKEKLKGKNINDIVDEFEMNPYILDEE